MAMSRRAFEARVRAKFPGKTYQLEFKYIPEAMVGETRKQATETILLYRERVKVLEPQVQASAIEAASRQLLAAVEIDRDVDAAAQRLRELYEKLDEWRRLRADISTNYMRGAPKSLANRIRDRQVEVWCRRKGALGWTILCLADSIDEAAEAVESVWTPEEIKRRMGAI